MSYQPVPFDWKQVDQTLANLMLAEVSEEFRDLIREDLQQIRYQNIGNQNAVTFPSQVLEMQLLRSEEWAGRTYEVYCEVWRCQQKSLSPEFLRAVCKHGIRVLIFARINSVSSELEQEQMRIHSHSTEWLKEATRSFRRDMEQLFGKWQRAAEIEAKSLEYMLGAAPNNPAVNNVARELVYARTQLRIVEAGIATLETKIAGFAGALSATKLREKDAYRVRTIEQYLERFNADKKNLESRRDHWQLNLKTTLNRSAEIRKHDISDQRLLPANHVEIREMTSSKAEGAQIWHRLHVEFKTLAEEELKIDPHNKTDRWLRAYVTRDEKAGEGCHLSKGVGEGFKARFEVFANRAGIALGAQPTRTPPIEFWLRAVFEHLLLHKSRELFAADKKGGIILRACEASAICCARFEKSALEQLSGGEVQALDNQARIRDTAIRERQLRVAPKVNYASGLKRAIALLLSISPDASDLQICRSLDEDGAIELPTSWTTGANRLFEIAYKDPNHRRKVEIMISKVRTQMREKGLLR